MSPAVSTDARAFSAGLPLEHSDPQSPPNTVMEEQQPAGGSPPETVLDAVPETTVLSADHHSGQSQVFQQPNAALAVPEMGTEQPVAEPTEAVSHEQLEPLPTASDSPAEADTLAEAAEPDPQTADELGDNPAAAATDGGAADATEVQTDRPRTRLRRSAGSIQAGTPASSPPKAAPEPKSKPKMASGTKPKANLSPVKQPKLKAMACKSKQAKAERKVGSPQQGKKVAPPAAAAQKQPQHLAQRLGNSKPASKTGASVKAGKRKHGDMMSAGKAQGMAHASSAAPASTSPAAGKKRLSGSRYMSPALACCWHSPWHCSV